MKNRKFKYMTASKYTETVIKNILQNKIAGSDHVTGKFYQTFKED